MQKIPFADSTLVKHTNNPEGYGITLYFLTIAVVNKLSYFSIEVAFLIKYLLNLIKWLSVAITFCKYLIHCVWD